MKYTLSISDHSKSMRVLRNTGFIGISSILIIAFLFKFKLLDIDSIVSYFLLGGAIFIPPIFLMIKLKGITSKESLLIDNEYIQSSKYGIIELKNIKRYKLLKLNTEVIILIMQDGSRYAINAINLKEEYYFKYIEFRDQLIEIINKKNIKFKSQGKDLILEKKSYYTYFKYIRIVIFSIILLFCLLKLFSLI